MKQTRFFIILFAFFCCNFVPSKAILAGKNYTEKEVTDGGTVIGHVKYRGELTAVGLNLYRDWELSDTSKATSEKLIFSKINNGLKNAVVSLPNISQGKKKALPVIRPIIDQQNNYFIPHVIAIVSGTTVDFLNGDEELHNIHTRSTRNQPFNLGTTYKQRISKKFDYPEIIKVTCDLHKNASAWIVVLDHPYFDMTDRNGYFEICDIPPGTYTFQVWHEELGNLEKEVTVQPKETTTIEFVYHEK
ncbi:MAG: hypothetical protein B6D35_06930 [Candidatus Brocadia sp. UTAMX2]|jgi:plastocyanin|nr:MAG: hypothetical protein B6D35_06930 [Candidatus Brocadia sp. UTAMX2]